MIISKSDISKSDISKEKKREKEKLGVSVVGGEGGAVVRCSWKSELKEERRNPQLFIRTPRPSYAHT